MDLIRLLIGPKSIVDDVSFDMYMCLRRALLDGWELDLFSTIASRKGSRHMQVGPYRLVKVIK